MKRKEIRYTASLIALLTDVLFLFIGVLVYTKIPYFNTFLSDKLVSLLPLLTSCFLVCSLCCFLFDIWVEKEYQSTSYKACSYLYQTIGNFGRKQPILVHESYQYAFFISLIKWIFVPIMLQFTVNNFGAVLQIITDWHTGSSENLNFYLFFNYTIYPLLLRLCFFVDTVIFLFAYLIYSKALGNTIKSVDTSFLGWFSALLCYPPLHHLTDYFLPAHHDDYAFFWSEKWTFVFRILLLTLLIIYTQATLHLGWKSSNLTNRGLVSHGPYAVVRHPAYIAKNLFWWVTLIPVIPVYPMAMVYMAGISFIYYLRALTEERHLKKCPEYRNYCEKVKYRFLPKIKF